MNCSCGVLSEFSVSGSQCAVKLPSAVCIVNTESNDDDKRHLVVQQNAIGALRFSQDVFLQLLLHGFNPPVRRIDKQHVKSMSDRREMPVFSRLRYGLSRSRRTNGRELTYRIGSCHAMTMRSQSFTCTCTCSDHLSEIEPSSDISRFQVAQHRGFDPLISPCSRQASLLQAPKARSHLYGRCEK